MPDPADLPCLSLHAPWLWAIMHAGKCIENRSDRFPQYHRGKGVAGPVWLHASKWPGQFGPLRPLRGKPAMEWGEELTAVETVLRRLSVGRRLTSDEVSRMWSMRGHIVGRVDVLGYVGPDDDVESPWYQGGFGIVVGRPLLLATPVPAKGALGWWSPDEATKAALRRQLVTP